MAAGNLKSVGNDRVDGLAKEAAAGAGSHYSPDPRFADVVQLQDASGTWIMDVGSAVAETAWESRRKEATKRRSWLAQLYPDGLELDWKTSVYLFHPPKVMSGRFVHNASPPVLKWIARARSGALATNARKASTGLGMDSAGCPCCDATLEDDAHVVAGCPQTGSADCEAAAAQLWLKIITDKGVKVGPLPSAWVHTYRLQLAVGLIPQSMSAFLAASQDWMVPVVLRAFHLGMGEWLAEILRRRETMVGQARQAAGAPHRPGAAVVPSPAFQARQLSVAELRVADQQPLSPPRSAVAREVKLSRTIANKLAAELELPRWIKTHHFLHAVPVEQGEPSIALLLLWEADHKKEYPSQAVELMARLVSFTKRLTAAVEADAELKVWLVKSRYAVP